MLIQFLSGSQWWVWILHVVIHFIVMNAVWLCGLCSCVATVLLEKIWIHFLIFWFIIALIRDCCAIWEHLISCTSCCSIVNVCLRVEMRFWRWNGSTCLLPSYSCLSLVSDGTAWKALLISIPELLSPSPIAIMVHCDGWSRVAATTPRPRNTWPGDGACPLAIASCWRPVSKKVRGMNNHGRNQIENAECTICFHIVLMCLRSEMSASPLNKGWARTVDTTCSVIIAHDTKHIQELCVLMEQYYSLSESYGRGGDNMLPYTTHCSCWSRTCRPAPCPVCPSYPEWNKTKWKRNWINNTRNEYSAARELWTRPLNGHGPGHKHLSPIYRGTSTSSPPNKA